MSASLPFTVMPCPCCGSMKIAISTTTNALTNLPRNDRPVCLECGVRAETLEAWNKRTARPEALRNEWRPIESVQLGQMVMLTHRAWRHAWAGQVINKETGQCVLDSPTPEHQDALPYFAEHWMPLLSAPSPRGKQ